VIFRYRVALVSLSEFILLSQTSTANVKKDWSSLEAQRAFLESIAPKLGVSASDPDSWYRVTTKDIIRQGGERLLKKYDNSMSNLLAAVFSERSWDALRFSRAPRNYWDSMDHQREFIAKVELSLGITEHTRHRWYAVRNQTLLDQGGSAVLARYKGSLAALLAAVIPEYRWEASRFITRSYWHSIDNQRSFMDEAARQLDLPAGDRAAWYKVSRRALVSKGGSAVLALYNDSLPLLLRSLYPDFPWDRSKFLRPPKTHWHAIENQKAFMDSLALKLGFDPSSAERWYKLTNQVVSDNGGDPILQRYGKSLPRLLQAVYPEVAWETRRFPRAPKSYWETPENQRAYLEELARLLGFNKDDMEAWYKVNNQLIVDHGGRALLALHGNSLPALLTAVFPDHSWDPLRFTNTPRNYWLSLEHQRTFMDSLGRSLGFAEGERAAWYKVTSRTVINHGGVGLLRRHADSLSKLLAAVYPDYPWDFTKFSKAPQNYWVSVAHQRAFVDQLGRTLGFKEGDLDAWYTVPHRVFYEHGGRGVLKIYHGSIPALLAAIYPEFNWRPWRFPKSTGRVKGNVALLNAMVDDVESALGLHNADDWLRVKAEQLDALRVPRSLRGRGGLLDGLQRRYPETDWLSSTVITSGDDTASSPRIPNTQ